MTETPSIILVTQRQTSSQKTKDKIGELVELAVSAGYRVAKVIAAPRRPPSPSTYFSRGIVEQIDVALTEFTHAEQPIAAVLVGEDLRSSQERTLSETLKTKVVDRTGLILNVFSRHAGSEEGKIEVEIARLDYEGSRLAGRWTHLERQRGGIGVRGGPGERQIDLDRHEMRRRRQRLQKKLTSVASQRAVARRSRSAGRRPVVALVGYTNAGKSSLFRWLSAADVVIDDRMFATLDTRMRRTWIPAFGEIILVDTVGLIQDLPKGLAKAFAATFEEVTAADVIVQVSECGHPREDDRHQETLSWLETLQLGSRPYVLVRSKVDLICSSTSARRMTRGHTVWVSAERGWNKEALGRAIAVGLLESGYLPSDTVSSVSDVA